MEEQTLAADSAASSETGATLSTKKLTPLEVLQQQRADLDLRIAAVIDTENCKAHFLDSEGNPHVDQFSIDGGLLRTSGQAMEARMRAGHFPNWHTSSPDDIKTRAKAAIDEGDYIGAASLSSMLHAHRALAS